MSPPVQHLAVAGGSEPISLIVRHDSRLAELASADASSLGLETRSRFETLGMMVVSLSAEQLVHLANTEAI